MVIATTEATKLKATLSGLLLLLLLSAASPMASDAPVRRSTFASLHGDFVHDVSFDYQGKRLATCSSDHVVRLWRRGGGGGGEGEWAPDAVLEGGHRGPVTRVAWAHPDFGAVVASASLDRTVAVWEEWAAAAAATATSPTTSTWRKVATLGGIQSDVTGVAFAPKHCGLRLAVCSADDWVRIFSASESNWTLSESFRLSDASSAALPAPASGPSSTALASLTPAMDESPFQASSLAWCSYAHDGPAMVVGTAAPGDASVWRFDVGRKKWMPCARLGSATPTIGSDAHTGAVNSVSWAPNMGRSFHLIATASSDGTAKVWRVGPASSAANDDDDPDASWATDSPAILSDGPVVATCVDTLDHGPHAVWRVEFSATGATLATSCDDGLVRLWQPNLKGKWVLLSRFAPSDDVSPSSS